MSTSLVVVAIPEETDRVWKVSSQEVPHLTLLYLGDDVSQVQNLDQIMQFVEHAVTLSEHGPFYLDVDHRGTLGEAEADVLFFNKRSWNLKWIRQFRGQLLQNQAVRTAFDSTEQILEAPQEWAPHLTLGYPDKPAKELPDNGFDHPLYSVCFDRIAVWAEEFNGPEFRLEWPDRELEGDLAIAYSDQQKAALMHGGKLATPIEVAEERGAEFLAHYGKKGMKWGVRNSETKKGMFDPEGHDKGTDIVKSVVWPLVPPLGLFAIPAQVRLARASARGVKAKAVDVNEKRFQKHAASAKNFVEIHNRSGERFNREIGAINQKHTGDLTKDPKKQAAYDKDVEALLQKSYKEAANSIGNRSKTMHLDVKFHNGTDFTIHAKEGAPTPLPQPVQQAKAGEGNVGSAGTGTSAFKHAAEDDTVTLEVTGKIERDATGHIVGFTIDTSDSTTLAQTADLGAEFLAHYGVKGMQWGVRNTSRSSSTPAGLLSRKPPKAVAPKATSKVPHGSRRKTKVEAEGGENHPAHEDAIKVAKSKVKLKKSGPSALSNQELQEVATRIRLEEQATQLTRSAGSKFIRRLLTNQGNQAANQFVKSEVDSRVFRKGSK